jgi:N-acetylneuraminate synthase/N,N'-diacetyllegionaminate synthase
MNKLNEHISEQPYFIAEAGVNHNGDLEIAKELIDAAADAEASAVKFQTFSAERLVSETASTADYQQEQTGIESQREMLRQYELGQSDHKELQSYCESREITFLSTPFDLESVDMLIDIGVPAIKLGSGELDNFPLLEHVAETDIPMIVSTGMGTIDEVKSAYDRIQAVDSSTDVVFLHCTTSYPCTLDNVNLRAMKTMAKELPVPVGYSDHTTLPETPALAVAAGASVVEKHFTIDRSLPGPDHEASLEPDELARAVELVEKASTILGNVEKRPTSAELEIMKKIRKGLHAAVNIDSGTEITADHIDVLRPQTGLSPSRYDELIGSHSATDITSGEPITAADIEGMEGDED